MAQKDGAVSPVTLESWLDTRPSWLRMAADGLVRDRRNPNEQEIDALADHCMQEAAKTLATKHPALAPGIILGTPSAGSLRIDSMSNIRGVNAIGADAVLGLSKGHMTVVYGPNGSGKSGYARLIKHMCGARAKGLIHGNVFHDAQQSASAQVSITTSSAIDGTSTTTDLSWAAASGPHPKLTAVPVFDSATAMELGDTPSEATYLPRSMRFVGALITIADRVGKRLEDRASQLHSHLPAPAEHAQTASGRFLQSLKPTLDHDAISKACAFPDALLQERLALETALAQANPADAHAKAIADLDRLAKSAESMAELAEALGDEKALGLIGARKIAADKRQAATAYATSFIQGMPLKGVGDTVWETLWEAAKTYSTVHAYPEHAYPHVGDEARCVLCQQPLEAEGKARLKSFEEYLNATLQTEAKAAEVTLATLTLPVPTDATTPAWQAQCAAVGLDNEQATALAQGINARIKAMGDATALSDVPAIAWSLWADALASTIATTTGQRDALATLLDPAGRAQKEARLRELKAQEWLASQIEAVKVEIERLKKLAILTKALPSTKTGPLTTKSNEIGRLELAQGYCDRFNAELQGLGGGSLPVRMSHKSSGKGIYSFYIELKDSTSSVKNKDVLSEGEQRIVALAAFFADATGADRGLPVIFDDPISSLDQRYEEAVTKRLVSLAEQRQVIVFTHRLSLMALLRSAAKQRADLALPPVEVTTVAIGRDGASTGMPATIDAFSLKPKAGFEQMKSSIGSIKKQDAEFRAILLKAACSNFRILVERSVEDDLCSGVVNRFRREIRTLNVLQRLHAITADDCALINEMMTKYSAFEHSQPTETPIWLPDPEELLADVQTMLDWSKKFNERAEAAAKSHS
ncbi:AAA family ATPase [Stenotrophomonas maltophilia]|uniref:AAA family ATPase n=1 Tax=Stenotrophomonas maltophilia TaxID=40324 RepID=UPI00209A879A|nr:AAA family ATPase [Stenotrophomonas maltophilia]MCO7473039.1 AAA family ATPase [Stenotrophomonas maltophilia]